MKVLIVTAYGGWGSTGKICDSIATVLEEHGHEAFLAYGFYDSCHSKKLKLKTGARYMSFYEIFRCRLTGYMGFTSKHATQKLINWIQEIQPDVINLHNVHGGYVHIEKLFDFLKKSNIPIVWTIHDCWSFTGHCAHFQRVNCNRWKTGCHDCPDRALKKSYPISYFFDRSVEQYQRKKNAFTNVPNLTMVTPSFWLKNLVEQSYLGYADIRAIHNGINTSVFSPIESDAKKRLGCEHKKLVLAVSSGWGIRKGYNYLIELARQLSSEEFQLMIVGLNEKQLKELPDNIIGMGRMVNQKKLAEIYSAADVLVNPTMEDNYPTVNLESIACGTPVVTFKTGGSPESISEKTGAVVEQGDINKLIENIKFWTRQTPRKECREYAEQYFSDKNCFLNYLRLFEEVYNKNR